MDQTKIFAEGARGLAKNPLGIIALFIVLVYGFASLVVGCGAGLGSAERMPLIYFMVVFPVLVLGVFAWLVSCHTGKLYSPGEYKDESNYVAVIASLAAASASRPTSDEPMAKLDVEKIATAVNRSTPAVRSEARCSRILWVDDRPENNTYERQAFEAAGLSVVLALSTQQALDQMDKESFIAVISDMGRKEGPREGYVLLDTLRNKGDRTPFFIYASSNLPEHRREAFKHGAQGSTNNPSELFEQVISVVPRFKRNA